MEFTLEDITFDNCEKAYEIDRSDIPDYFVEDVPTLIDTIRFGFENELEGRAFFVKADGRYVGTIMIGEGIVCELDPPQVQDIPFYRLMFFVIDKRYRGEGLGSEVMEAAAEKVFDDYGVRPIVLEVHKDNVRAAVFYERNGFTKTPNMEKDDFFFIRGV